MNQSCSCAPVFPGNAGGGGIRNSGFPALNIPWEGDLGEGNSWKWMQKNEFCSHPLRWNIPPPLEQKESGILDAHSKFKNILISFSRIADREGEEEEGIIDSAKYCVEKMDPTHL